MTTLTSPTDVVTVRQLPPDEWERLRALPFATNGLPPNPELTAILVAENAEGAIVGVWAAMTAVHLDGLWVAPEYRRTSRVAMKLLRGMKDMLLRLGVVQSFTIASSTEVLVLALKAGFQRMHGDLCFLDLSAADEGEQPCP